MPCYEETNRFTHVLASIMTQSTLWCLLNLPSAACSRVVWKLVQPCGARWIRPLSSLQLPAAGGA